MTDYEKFICDRGSEFTSADAIKDGYDRLWKSQHNILITAEEFEEEARVGDLGCLYSKETLGEVYDSLESLVSAKMLEASEVYKYARFKWCLKDPDAIEWYQISDKRWIVNNCGTDIDERIATLQVNEKWGFEASRIAIINTPYYESTDYQFIRFDCAGTEWLWHNGCLSQVIG